MYTDKHITALLEALADARSEITSLREQLDIASKEAARNWNWYTEEEKKVKELEAARNQPRI